MRIIQSIVLTSIWLAYNTLPVEKFG